MPSGAGGPGGGGSWAAGGVRYTRPSVMPKTLCPSCGHSPIPRGADACPACGEPFDHLAAYKKVGRARLDQLRAEEDDDQTVFGGDLVTNAVSAHPGPVALVLAFVAGAWFVRAGGVLGTALQDPPWTYGLVALDLVLALVLLLNRGPAKALAQAGLALQFLATAWLAREAPTAPVHLAYVALGLVPLAMIAGEPGQTRRYVGAGLGLGLACVAPLLIPNQLLEAGKNLRRVLVGSELGYRLELPEGWVLLAPVQLAPHLAMPASTLSGGGAAFGDPERGRYGVLWVDRGAGQGLTDGCQALLKSVGGAAGARPLSRPAPLALGRQSLVYALDTSSGARGALGCGLLGDGRLVGIAVVAASAEEGKGESAFAVVGEGLALQ